MNKIKTFFTKFRKKIAVVAVAAVSALAMSVAAFAEDGTSALEGASGQITEQFTKAASDITPIILGVLGAGLGIFVVFVGIRLAKRMFTTVSK